jgi:hypothetical protein
MTTDSTCSMTDPFGPTGRQHDPQSRHHTALPLDQAIDEPGYTNVPEPYGYDIDPELSESPMFLEGFWNRLYGSNPALKAQEN